MSDIPSDLRYTAEHEWVAAGDPVTVGITAHAADALGDVVYLELPEVGASVVAGSVCGEIESTKSVSELFAPVDGVVVEVNTAAVDDPSMVNADPYGTGWLLKVRTATDLAGLLGSEQYAALVGE